MAKISRNSTFKHRSLIVTLALPLLGIILIALSQTFHAERFNIEWERVIAEVGALLLVVSVLHWFFELGLREEMLREVADKVTGGALLHDAGLESCCLDSKKVEDRLHWARCANLTIGRQYSTRFLKDFHELLKERCANGLATTLLVLSADGAAANYLTNTGIGNDVVGKSVKETLDLVAEYDRGTKPHIRVAFHDSVLRYAFIQTDEYTWITFYRNSPGRATVPAFKVRVGTVLYEFFDQDIRDLLEHSRGAK